VVRSPPDDALALVARDPALAEAVNREMARLMIATRRIVADNRAVIERVAEALTSISTLDGQSLCELIEASRPAGEASPQARVVLGQAG
jgi:CRP-like cAMP-binding protein